MPRIARAAPGGVVHHCLNRGNDRKIIFRKPADFDAFLQLLAEGKARFTVTILAFCLMDNHWHLSLLPAADDDLSNFIGWICNAHVRRYRLHYHTAGQGHLYQGRFKSFPVKDDPHLLLMHRYVEANALRAGMVTRAEDWPYSSLHHAIHGDPLRLVDPWPVARPDDWVRFVNEPVAESETALLRQNVVRSRPFGDDDWVMTMAKLLGLEFTLRPRGRPKRPTVKAHVAGETDGEE
ncbi:MAG TPA: transposase [Tepidisphaeraceae bacterium]|jgi:putative transposase